MYDEAVDVIDPEEVITPPMSSDAGRSSPADRASDGSPSDIRKNGGSWQLPDRGLVAQLSDHTDNTDDDDEDDDDVRAPMLQGGYDPSEYDELAVSSEVKELFSHITKYVPQNIDLDNKLSPFLPDLIPAVGDIDGFLKIPRPDGTKDALGLTVLDEPCTVQSDPALLQLQLRALARQTVAKSVVVKKVANADVNPKAVDKWINAISDLHQRKPPTTVHYSRPMPNLDNLMQEWPPKMEEQFQNDIIPNPELDCDLETYVSILCNIFDIPVYESKVQSLHLLFNLFSTIKSTRSQIVQDIGDAQEEINAD